MTSANQRQIKMDIRSAVNYAEAQILHKVPAFFVNTEFGRIAIETNGLGKIDPVHPVMVVPWKEAPNTSWAVSQADETADYYVSIDIFNSMLSDHLSVVEGFTRCIFMSLGCNNVDDSVINAAVYIFIDNYDTYSINVNSIEREFLKNHFSGLKKTDPVIRALVRELQQQKLTMAEKIYGKSKKLMEKHIKSNEVDEMKFYDPYCKDLFGLILYANTEAKEEADQSYHLLVTYKDEADIMKSTRFIAEAIPRQ